MAIFLFWLRALPYIYFEILGHVHSLENWVWRPYSLLVKKSSIVEPKKKDEERYLQKYCMKKFWSSNLVFAQLSKLLEIPIALEEYQILVNLMAYGMKTSCSLNIMPTLAIVWWSNLVESEVSDIFVDLGQLLCKYFYHSAAMKQLWFQRLASTEPPHSRYGAAVDPAQSHREPHRSRQIATMEPPRSCTELPWSRLVATEEPPRGPLGDITEPPRESHVANTGWPWSHCIPVARSVMKFSWFGRISNIGKFSGIKTEKILFPCSPLVFLRKLDLISSKVSVILVNSVEYAK